MVIRLERGYLVVMMVEAMLEQEDCLSRWEMLLNALNWVMRVYSRYS